MRYAKRVDQNQSAIVAALRAAGARVVDMSRSAGGFPDLVVAFRGLLYLLEIKNGSAPKKDRRLKKTQEDLHALMAEAGVTVHVVLTVDDALRAIGAIQ